MPRLQPPTPPKGVRCVVRDRWGRKVVLTESRWRHIVTGHPAMDGFDMALKSALEGADQRREGNGAEKIYGKNLGPAKWLVVVVAYDESHTGNVLTAYPQRRDRPAGREIH